MYNRRDFIARSTAAGIGLSLGLPRLSAVALTARALYAGTQLAPLLLTEDALRLALLDPSMGGEFKAVLIKHKAFLQSCGAYRGPEGNVLELIKELRDGWSTRDRLKVENHTASGDMYEPKLAFAAGWMTRSAALFELYGGTDPGLDEKTLYQDVALLHALRESEPTKSAGDASVSQLAHLIQMMHLRTYVRMHTIDPDFDDPEGWILRVVRRNEELENLSKQFASVYLEPDAALMAKYVEEPNFYDASDPLLKLARSLHQGITEIPIDLHAAVSAAASQSQYARALSRAYKALHSAGAFHGGSMDESHLRIALQHP